MFEVGKKYRINTKEGRYYKGEILEVTDKLLIFKGKFGKEGVAIDVISNFQEVESDES